MGKIENEAFLATSRALDRERKKNSVRSMLTLFVFIPAVVIGICVLAFLLTE